MSCSSTYPRFRPRVQPTLRSRAPCSTNTSSPFRTRPVGDTQKLTEREPKDPPNLGANLTASDELVFLRTTDNRDEPHKQQHESETDSHRRHFFLPTRQTRKRYDPNLVICMHAYVCTTDTSTRPNITQINLTLKPNIERERERETLRLKSQTPTERERPTQTQHKSPRHERSPRPASSPSTQRDRRFRRPAWALKTIKRGRQSCRACTTK